jgi:hypothetical protein
MEDNNQVLDNLNTLLSGNRSYVFRPNENLVLMRLNGNVIEFYPALNQWRCDGKTYHGDARDLLAWMDKQERESIK